MGGIRVGKRKNRKALAGAAAYKSTCSYKICRNVLLWQGNRESDSGWDEKGKKKSRKAGAA